MIEEKLVKAITARLREIEAGLVQTPAEDHAKYNRIVGTHHGLQEALQLLHDLLHPKDEE